MEKLRDVGTHSFEFITGEADIASRIKFDDVTYVDPLANNQEFYNPHTFGKKVGELFKQSF